MRNNDVACRFTVLFFLSHCFYGVLFFFTKQNCTVPMRLTCSNIYDKTQGKKISCKTSKYTILVGFFLLLAFCLLLFLFSSLIVSLFLLYKTVRNEESATSTVR